jgi:hypothetical protein
MVIEIIKFNNKSCPNNNTSHTHLVLLYLFAAKSVKYFLVFLCALGVFVVFLP